VEIVRLNYAEIQKVKSSFELENSISGTLICNKFRFFKPWFTSLATWSSVIGSVFRIHSLVFAAVGPVALNSKTKTIVGWI